MELNDGEDPFAETLSGLRGTSYNFRLKVWIVQVRLNLCKHSRINILLWIILKLVEQLPVVGNKLFRLVPVVWLLNTLDSLHSRLDAEHDAATLKGKTHAHGWILEGLHEHKVVLGECTQGLDRLVKEGLSNCKFLLTFLSNVISYLFLCFCLLSFFVDHLFDGKHFF